MHNGFFEFVNLQTIVLTRADTEQTHNAIARKFALKDKLMNKRGIDYRSLQALCSAESDFQDLADDAPVIIWVVDASGYCICLNQKWCEFTGQSREEGVVC